jgi:hypothetical protein
MRIITKAVAIGLTGALALLPTAALAQRGTGAATGVARSADRPEIVTLKGRLIEIKTGPCEATTGRAAAGTHLILETRDEETLNVHLGPASEVADHVSKLKVGKNVAVEAFRTDAMKDAQYIARTITSGGTTITLRDPATLRPEWAPGRGAGMGPGRGAGMGLGRGAGMGPGRGNGRGRGAGMGPGLGNGRGSGRGNGPGGGGPNAGGCWRVNR